MLRAAGSPAAVTTPRSGSGTYQPLRRSRSSCEGTKAESWHLRSIIWAGVSPLQAKMRARARGACSSPSPKRSWYSSLTTECRHWHSAQGAGGSRQEAATAPSACGTSNVPKPGRESFSGMRGEFRPSPSTIGAAGSPAGAMTAPPASGTCKVPSSSHASCAGMRALFGAGRSTPGADGLPLPAMTAQRGCGPWTPASYWTLRVERRDETSPLRNGGSTRGTNPTASPASGFQAAPETVASRVLQQAADLPDGE